VSQPRGLRDRLARVNETAVFLAVLAFALVGLFVPGILGGALLLLMVLGLGLLVAATWEKRAVANHALRIVVLLLFLVVAVSKLL
jgi:hypothetical protein